MNQHISIPAPAGHLEVAPLWQHNDPATDLVRDIALLCHPHPLFQGTMDNKVVTTMARFARDVGMHVVRFNFRGVGASTGVHDAGIGEVDDALAVLAWALQQTPARRLWLGGFSFGGYVAARVAEQLSINQDEDRARILSAEILSAGHNLELSRVALIAPSVVAQDVSDLRLPAERTLMVYGDADEVIAPEAMASFAELHGLKSVILPDASHFFHGRLTELKTILTEDYQQHC